MTHLRILATDKPMAEKTRGPILPMREEDRVFWDWIASRRPLCHGFGKR